MEKVSTYDLALVIGGFVVGAAFIIMIFNMLDGGRRGGRGHRRHRHYDRGDRRYYSDDNYEYEQEESGFLPIILVLLLGIGGVALAQKMGVFKSQQTEISTTQSSKKAEETTEQTSDTLVQTPRQSPNKLREVYYAPPADEPEVEMPVTEPAQDYYIRVCVLTKRDNVISQCNALKKAGCTVCTMPKGDDVAVYAGPYQSLEKAEQVNETKGLDGVIESYAK